MPTSNDSINSIDTFDSIDSINNTTQLSQDIFANEDNEENDFFETDTPIHSEEGKHSILSSILLLFLTLSIIVVGLGIYVVHTGLEDDILSLVHDTFPEFYATASSTIIEDTTEETLDAVIEIIDDFSLVEEEVVEEIVEELPLYPEIDVPAPLDYTIEEALAVLEKYAIIDDRFTDILLQQEDYPEELLITLSNNPEMLNFVSNYNTIIPTFNDDPSSVILTDEEISSACPLFLQWDERWGYAAYGDNYLFASGCGPTALSMVVQGLTGDDSISPLTIANFAMENDYYMFGTGTMWNLMLEGATNFGLTSYCLHNNEELMKERLDQGDYLICSVGAGDFTAAGHFIVIYDYDETGFIVNDPFCYARSQVTWTFEQISPQIKSIWTLGVA
ncbi:MAG: C39 family peptidase [Eubacteriales bacterium]